MERQNTMAYGLSKILFNQIYAKHPEEKKVLHEMFTHLWSDFWNGTENLPNEVYLVNYKHIRRCDRIMTRLADMDIVTHSRGTLRLEKSGRGLLESAYREMTMDEVRNNMNELINQIEAIKKSLAETDNLVIGLAERVKVVEGQMRYMMRHSIKPV